MEINSVTKMTEKRSTRKRVYVCVQSTEVEQAFTVTQLVIEEYPPQQGTCFYVLIRNIRENKATRGR